MADPVDAKKHCSSLKTEALKRSCEVLTEECNDQQRRNVSQYALAGPDNNRIIMSSAAQCFQSSLAIPRKSGPLPAARLAQAKAPSSPGAQGNSPPDYSGCERFGQPGSKKATVCRKVIDLCLSNPTDSYTIETDHGPYKSKDKETCLILAPVFAEREYEIKGASAQSPKPAPQETKKTDAPPPPKDNAAPKKDHPPSPPATDYSRCENVGKQGSAANLSCRQITDKCMSGDGGPILLDTDHGPFTPKDRETCLLIAPTLASRGYSIGGIKPPASEQEPDKKPAPSDEGQDKTQNQSPGVRLLKSFADVGFNIRVTDQSPVEENKLLLFEGIKGIPITIKYTARRLKPGRYRIDYTIYKDGSSIGSEQTLEFDARGRQINLGFEVILWSAGNFGRVKSIRIVSL